MYLPTRLIKVTEKYVLPIVSNSIYFLVVLYTYKERIVNICNL